MRNPHVPLRKDHDFRDIAVKSQAIRIPTTMSVQVGRRWYFSRSLMKTAATRQPFASGSTAPTGAAEPQDNPRFLAGWCHAHGGPAYSASGLKAPKARAFPTGLGLAQGSNATTRYTTERINTGGNPGLDWMPAERDTAAS
jgi:hypothetical protein